MCITRLHIRCIFFLASLTLCYSKHISFYVEDVNRILPQKGNCDGVCLTPECVKTAARVISNLDESVDPCDNFYRFACGGWLSSHVIPKGKDHVSVDTTIADDINLKLQVLIERKLDGTEPAFVKMLKDMYDSCIDVDTIYKLGIEPLKEDLANLGGWPVVEGSEWNESSFDWVDTLISFRRLGYDFQMLNSLAIEEDMHNRTIKVIVLRQPSLGGRENLIHGLNDSETAADYKTGVEEAVLLGADVTMAEKDLLEALQFKIELAKIIRPQEDDDDKKDENEDINIEKEDINVEKEDINVEKEDAKSVSRIKKENTVAGLREERMRRERRAVSGMYGKYTVAELQDMIPEIPWLKFFNGLLNFEIQETENVVVSDPSFFKRLASLLERTEKRVVANYMFWRAVSELEGFMSFIKKEDSEDESQDISRQEQCFDQVKTHLLIALNTYFVRHFFGEERKNAVMEMVKYIHRDFLRILEGSDWMDDMTKKNAIEKANSMKIYIGYPKELLNDTAVMEIYKNLTISNNTFFKNSMNLRKLSKDKEFSSLRKPSVKGQWLSHAEYTSEVNAFYYWNENSMEIPAGQLLNEYFEEDRPHYMNFGGIGWVIGHEITHGFDVYGKEYDKDGNKVDWWDKTTNELYQKRVQCMIEQYGNYTLEDGMKINGLFTIPDNIADNGGIKTAYRAYHSWVENNGPELLLPGIKYNQDQLFWINYAQTVCEKRELEALRKSLFEDPHSPPEYRVIVPLSNLPEFSKDFNCPSDSPMNIENKCHVW